MTTRRNLFDEFSSDVSIMSNVGSQIEVFLRVRDLTKEEKSKKSEKCVEISNNGDKISVRLPKDSISYKNVQNGVNVAHEFTFSKIFGPDVNQKQFYDSTMHGIIQRFLWGDNCLVFAYGATNSGKTYTVQGLLTNPGILPRSIDVIFNSIGDQLMSTVNVKPNYFDNVVKLSATAQRQEKALEDQLLNWGVESDTETFCTTYDPSMISKVMNSMSSDDSTASGRSCETFGSLRDAFYQIESRVKEDMSVQLGNKDVRYSVWISFAEIYNEFVYDLLQPLATARLRKRTCLKLAEDNRGNVFVKGLRRVSVSSPNDALKLLIVGQRNLRFAVTKLNQNSSRSHCIFTIETVCATNTENPKVVKISKLSFCDLAGSERYSKTRNTGDRLKEACSINTSLLVFRKMYEHFTDEPDTKDSLRLIPFRESRLTRLFQNFFARRGVVSMIVNISPETIMCDETIHVLKFSALAEQVVISPPHEEKRYQTKTSMLIAQLAQRGSVAWVEGESSADESDIERDELFEHIDELTKRIRELEKENQTIENRIRQEVSQQATLSLIETEKYYSQQMKENREAAENFAEKKIQMFIQQNANKRRKSDPEDDENYEAELEEKEKKIIELQTILDQVKSENQILKDEITALRKSNKRFSISQANARRYSTAIQIEASMQRKSSITDFNHIKTEAFHSLETKIAQLTQALASSQADNVYKEAELKRQNELVEIYEMKLAAQADKKKRLTVDNEFLKKELKDIKEKVEEEKENFEDDISNTVRRVLPSRAAKTKTPKPKIMKTPGSKSRKTSKTPKSKLQDNKSLNAELSDDSCEDSAETSSDRKDFESPENAPATVKRLYTNSVTPLLASPLNDTEEEINVHSQILEQLELK